MGRVWPRHGHRGRPLNSIVSRHLKPVAFIVAAFTVGFVLGHVWSIIAFREVLSGFVDAVTGRFLVVAAVETVVAGLVFAGVAASCAERQPVAASTRALVVAFLSGLIANALTVGPYAQVPPIIAGEPQVILSIVAIGLLSGLLAYLQVAVFGSRRRNDG